MQDHNFSVFVAEDEPKLLRSLVRKIDQARESFTVTGSATDGAAALEAVRQQKPDLLFTDIMMPEMDGLQLIARALTLHPGLRIVIISGHDDFALVKQALKLGVTDYLLKPVTLDEITDVLDRIESYLKLSLSEAEKTSIEELFYKQRLPDNLPCRIGQSGYLAAGLCLGAMVEKNRELCDDKKNLLKSAWHRIRRDIDMKEARSRPALFPIPEQLNIGYLILSCDSHNEDAEKVWKRIFNRITVLLPEMPLTLVYLKRAAQLRELTKIRPDLHTALRSSVRPGRSSCVPAGSFSTGTQKCLPDCSLSSELGTLAFFNKRELFISRLNSLLGRFLSATPTQQEITGYIGSLATRLAGAVGRDLQTVQQAQAELSLLLADPPKDKLGPALTDLLTRLFISENQRISPERLAGLTADYLDKHFSEDVSLIDLSRVLGYDQSYLSKNFKSFSGLSPKAYIIDKRISTAKGYLKDHPELEVQAIARMVGYEDAHYFSRIFRKTCSTTPREYRNKCG